MIVNIHGGPNDARERPRFQGRSAYFLNEMGIAIVYPNVRGSFGFGRSFEKLDDGRRREDAVVTYLENTEPGRQQDRRAEYGDEREPGMRDFLTSVSPVTLAGLIKAPLMIAHGRQDARVPIAQAESMHSEVKRNGVPVWLVVYEDAGHENFPRTQANSDFNFYTWILFAERHLLN